MYIAFKWLLGLTLAMWILLSMCGIDVKVKRSFEIKQDGYQKMLEMTRNTTISNRKVELRRHKYFKHISDKPHSAAGLPFFMFLAGALAVSLYNRKNEIVLFTRREISKFYTSAAFERLHESSKITANRACDCSKIYSKIVLFHMNNAIIKVWNKLYAFIMRKELQKPRINMMLLKKLQDIDKERKNLGQLLITAIHENKNIRMQYELENLAKNRLARHIENTQKVIKESRSSYVNFQQLYLVTHQENSFLKSRIRKLTVEKEQAGKNLLEIMNEVYKSKNKQLIDFCSRFIVKTGDNLLNADVGAEIQKFLEKSRTPAATTSNWQLSERPDLKVNPTSSSWSGCANPGFAEIIQDDILVPLVSDAPKLKGLPGEFVCTVKDKDGLIAKLYEYDFTSDFDDRDTIRRIREYSVYFDKDCLLDSINSRTVINNESSETRPVPPPRRFSRRCDSTNYPITTQRFLTGSQAFQKFMKNNKKFITPSTPKLPEPSLMNGGFIEV